MRSCLLVDGPSARVEMEKNILYINQYLALLEHGKLNDLELPDGTIVNLEYWSENFLLIDGVLTSKYSNVLENSELIKQIRDVVEIKVDFMNGVTN